MFLPVLKKRLLLCVVALLPLAGGCVVKDIGTTVEHTIKGDYYLRAEKYDQGRATFEKEVSQDPNNGLARYYYGRFLLQEKDNQAALKQLRKASTLDSDNVDFLFWTGIAYGENGDSKNEEISYRRALKLNKNHLQSLIYLGHNQLKKKKYTNALSLYSRALNIWSGSPSSLYNRALILKKLGRKPEEKRAWHAYLALYPSGAMARRATIHLNSLKDYSYRNHRLGGRVITIEKIWFEPFSAKLDSASYESLDLVGAIVRTLKTGSLQIIAYQKNNKALARRKALSIKNYLLEEFADINADRIGVSWFAQPQKVMIGKKQHLLDESISFFISVDKP